MKNLANCDPIEFTFQGYKVIEAAKDLITESKVLEIWAKKPNYTGNETPEERLEKAREQGKKRIFDVLGCLMRDNPEKTAQVLGLMCFIEPEDLKNHKGIEFIAPAVELLSNKDVIDFFLSLTSQIQSTSEVIG